MYQLKLHFLYYFSYHFNVYCNKEIVEISLLFGRFSLTNTQRFWSNAIKLSTFLFYVITYLYTYGVYVLPLIRYARVFFAYENFLKRGKLLTNKLMLQGYNESCLKSSFCKFYGHYNDLVCDYKLPLAHMLDDLFLTIC
jgi:hypothetical protein